MESSLKNGFPVQVMGISVTNKLSCKLSNKFLVTINCMQVTVLLEAAVIFILLATDVTGVTEATCRCTDTKRFAIFKKETTKTQ